MTSMQTISETLDSARGLLRELIDHYQTHEPTALPQSGLLRILVHVVNIQKVVEAGTDDLSNAVRRLFDFSNTIERMRPPPADGVDTGPVQQRLVATLRFAAEQLRPQPAIETWAAERTSAPAL